MDRRTVAAGVAQDLGGTARDRLVHNHVKRNPGARLVDVHDELVEVPAVEDLVAGLRDGAHERRVQAAHLEVRLGARLLDAGVRADQFGMGALPGNRVVFDRPGGLRPPVGFVRNFAQPEAVLLRSQTISWAAGLQRGRGVSRTSFATLAFFDAPPGLRRTESAVEGGTMTIEAKKYDDLVGNLEGFSPKQIEQHIKLYQGYVKKINEIRAEMEKIPFDERKDKANFSFGKYSELKRRESVPYNGTYLHEMYFDNLGGSRAKPKADLTRAIEGAFGSQSNWEEDLRACAETATGGWVLLTYDRIDEKLGHPERCP